MSQFPPPASPFPQQNFQPPAAPKSNGLAIASLICGLLGCVPFVTSLAAIILGVLGIKKAGQPQVGGKGLAIAGLVLGILGILSWSGGTVGMTAFYRYARTHMIEPAKLAGTSFINSLASGDIAKAETYTNGKFTPEELAKLSAQLKTYGKFKDFSVNQFNSSSTGADMHLNIGGTANFDSTSKGFNATIVGNPRDPSSFKIEAFTLD